MAGQTREQANRSGCKARLRRIHVLFTALFAVISRYNRRKDCMPMTTYIHQRDDWPHFRWDLTKLADLLAAVRNRQGLFLGRMEALGFELREEATLEVLTEDVQKSSEIEGERLDRQQVRSSIARRLGLDTVILIPTDRHVDGVVDMMLDATRGFEDPLTAKRLFGWHAALFPTGYSGRDRITVGGWRNDEEGPMQVVSGSLGHETVHYRAPAAELLDTEMSAFLNWFEAPAACDPVIKAALAYLWFATIHPFDDGNGRIGRAIADMALTRAEKSMQRFYSMSGQICKERKAYYEILERTQKGDMDVTEWMLWFLECLDRAIEGAGAVLEMVLSKARFWEAMRGVTLNPRQQLMLNRLLEGIEGKLTNAKWAKMAKCSSDTALRDMQDLVAKGVLVIDQAGGRSTSYSLRNFG